MFSVRIHISDTELGDLRWEAAQVAARDPRASTPGLKALARAQRHAVAALIAGKGIHNTDEEGLAVVVPVVIREEDHEPGSSCECL